MSAPCNSCDYLELCKGGCHCITEVLTWDIFAPDPECPFVYNHTDESKVERTSQNNLF
jgi:MoaA/NifB/PqqE/SkfB family radical SAM enzyme